jgi:uncharacterized protein (TIGR03437 family)
LKLTSNLAVIVAAAFLPLLPASKAATTLTGLQVISTDPSGNADLQSPQAWNTRNTSGRTKLWIINGDIDKPFLNGPTHLEAGIDIPMTSGTYTYSLFAEPINTVLKPHYSLSFFFNLDANPAITVFTQLNTTSNQFFPDWFPVADKNRVATMDGPTAQSNGKVEFVNGQTKVTVTSFSFSAPSVFKQDRVDRFRNGKSGAVDFIGQFTIQVSAPPEISNGGVVNAASFTPRLAPGSLFSIFGTDLAAAQENASAVPLPKVLSGTSVTIGGKEAPLVFVSPTQINAQVPYELTEGTTALVVVKVNGISSPQRTVQIVKAAPGIFQFGEKRAVVQNADATVNTADNPAEAGSYVVAYLTGCGPVDNAVATGGTAAAEPLSRPRAVVTATVGGTGAEVAFGGLTPGFIGLMQVNLKVPALPAGTHPLLITIDGVQSNAAVITVK